MADEGRCPCTSRRSNTKSFWRARRATEFATAASLRLQPLCRPADLSGDGCGGKRRRHPARHVRGQPQGCQVFSFKHPSAAELEHDFLWRTTRDLPERGQIGIFNRSYYEEVLIARVHPEILRSEGDSGHAARTTRRSGTTAIVRSWIWRRHLHANGTRIIKFFLHLSKDEQRKRFLARIDEPEKNWKFSLADIEERKFWKHYMKAYEECLSATSTQRLALVCRSRRRQGERSADRFPDCPRYVRRTQNDLPENERKAPARIAVDPQAAREVRF